MPKSSITREVPKLSIKKGDRVEVIAGKDKGKKGKVLVVQPKKGRVVVEGINMVKRHMRPTQKVPQGGIQEREAPIHVSNVQVICPGCGQPTRIGHRITESGVKVRVCRKCEGDIDKA
ncbi:MAG: 50S ribosomal protein L24 [Firmicutes bacterium]|nr:50S ribosomal protein L24 [Bacillota bacterium]